MSYIGRIATSQEQPGPAASQSSDPSQAAGAIPSSGALSSLKLTGPQQTAVDTVIANFEKRQTGSQPTPAQFQQLISQISMYLTPAQQSQLQTLIGTGSSGAAPAIATGNAALGEFDLINGGNRTTGLFRYLDAGDRGVIPEASDPNISASLWNFGAAGTPVQNALI